MDSSIFNAELKKLGITERQIKSWVEREFLLPQDAHPGKGNHREWSNEELRIAKTIVQLQNAGFTLRAASNYARTLIKSGTGFIDLSPKCTLIIELVT